ncbi:MAG: adenosylcobinamide-GDP ribazoletransferase [Clostridia bacterium]|nr:adenosylcobinamide-GDP ribazoletransferase [Clostridia bacterium]
MRLWSCAFFMAWGMFLAIPCPFPKWDEAARYRMLVCLPLVGAIVGGLWALSAYLLSLFPCHAAVRALVLTAVPALVTGFIHLDGFMDVSDAVLSSRDLEGRQKILKDPHAGAFAVLSALFLILAMFSLFFSWEYSAADLVPLALIPVAVRACAGIAVILLTPIETSQYSGGRKKTLAIPLFIMLAAALAVPAALYGVHGLAPAAAAAAYWASALFAKKRLGGMSGDISGYALSIGELIGIAVLVLIRSFVR